MVEISANSVKQTEVCKCKHCQRPFRSENKEDNECSVCLRLIGLGLNPINSN